MIIKYNYCCWISCQTSCGNCTLGLFPRQAESQSLMSGWWRKVDRYCKAQSQETGSYCLIPGLPETLSVKVLRDNKLGWEECVCKVPDRSTTLWSLGIFTGLVDWGPSGRLHECSFTFSRTSIQTSLSIKVLTKNRRLSRIRTV